jgi:uncharacterized coiled-coil protein SlyX
MPLSKLKSSLLLLAPIVSGAATGGGIWASTSARISAVESAHAETRSRIEKVEPVVAQHDTGIAVLNAKVDGVKDSLERIENKLGTK